MPEGYPVESSKRGKRIAFVATNQFVSAMARIFFHTLSLTDGKGGQRP